VPTPETLPSTVMGEGAIALERDDMKPSRFLFHGAERL